MEWVIGNSEWPEWQIIIVTGACRSGKTLLCRLLASFEHVEWIEEPYLISQLPIMHEKGLLNDESYRRLFVATIKEACVENILLRNANFRKGDLSSIYAMKTIEEIEYRSEKLISRKEALQYALDNKMIFVIDLPQIRSDVQWLLKSYESLKIINLIRNPFEVALDIEKKGWLSQSQIMCPQNNELHFVHTNCEEQLNYLWWINPSDYERYLEFSNFERGLYYWIKMNEELSKIISLKNVQLIRYEDLVSESKSIISMLETYLERNATAKTIQWQANLLEIQKVKSYGRIDEELRAELEPLILEFSYD